MSYMKNLLIQQQEEMENDDCIYRCNVAHENDLHEEYLQHEAVLTAETDLGELEFNEAQITSIERSSEFLRKILTGDTSVSSNPANDNCGPNIGEIHHRIVRPVEPACERLTYSLYPDGSDDHMHNGRDWREMLIRQKLVGVLDNEYNASVCVLYAPEFRNKMKLDFFSNNIMVDGLLPWKRESSAFWSYNDTLQLQLWLQGRGLPRMRYEIADRGLKHASQQNLYNPVRDYLCGLQWDGVPRLDTWLGDYFGVADSEFVRAISPKVLIAAVARAFNPGCKVDTVLVLEGNQGIGKSTAISNLFGEQFTTDNIPDLSNKDAEIQLQGVWAVELAELTQFKRNELETVKAFISRTIDRYRPPYERRAQSFPRQCVFFATTNESTYLKDSTGGRRFWPIHCTEINLDGLLKNRDQLWAEAVHRFSNNEQWWLNFEEDKLAAIEQESRFEEDAWGIAIDEILLTMTEKGTHNEGVRVSDISKELDMSIKERHALSQKRIKDHLTYRKWIQKRTAKSRLYFPTPEWIALAKSLSRRPKTKESLVDHMMLDSEAPCANYGYGY